MLLMSSWRFYQSQQPSGAWMSFAICVSKSYLSSFLFAFIKKQKEKKSTFCILGDKFHPQWKRALCSYVFLTITTFVLPKQPPPQLYNKNLLFKERHDSWDSCHASVYLLHWRRKNADPSSPHCTSDGSQGSKTAADDWKKKSYNVVCGKSCLPNRPECYRVTKTKTWLKKRSLAIKRQRIPG